MTEAEIIQKAIAAIGNGSRHRYYRRTIEVAKLCRQLATGDGIEELLTPFTRREDAAAFSQRKEITKQVVPSVVCNIMDTFNKVPRANYQRFMSYREEVDGKKEALDAIVQSFHGEWTLDEYVKVRLPELNTIDPNAWIVVEFAPFDGSKERAKPYPFEVRSEAAIMYDHDPKGRLLYLLVEGKAKYPTANGAEAEGKKYTLYLPDRAVVFTQRDNTGLSPSSAGEIVRTGEGAYFRDQSGIAYSVIEPKPYRLGRVPAIRAGYVRDLNTDGMVYLPPYQKAIPYLLKTIKAVSELDLAIALTAFPLPVRMGDPCENTECLNGYTADGSGTCGTCHGTGIKPRPTTVQEEYVVRRPREGEPQIGIKDVIDYQSPPIETLAFMDAFVEKLVRRAKEAVFNSDTLTRNQVAETATGQNIDLQNVYDTLFPFSVKFARTWEFLVRTSAQIADLDAGLYASIIFPKDFKLKGLSDLMSDLKTANESGAAEIAIRQTNESIARILYADDTVGLERYLVRDAFNPFSGKSRAETAFLLTSDLVPRREKVLYANLGRIFDELEAEQVLASRDFYSLNREVQRELVAAKVTAYMNETGAATRPILPTDTATDGEN